MTKILAKRSNPRQIEDAIAKRVLTLNPFNTFRPIDPDPKDVDKLIIEAARLIQHPPTERTGKHNTGCR